MADFKSNGWVQIFLENEGSEKILVWFWTFLAKILEEGGSQGVWLKHCWLVIAGYHKLYCMFTVSQRQRVCLPPLGLVILFKQLAKSLKGTKVHEGAWFLVNKILTDVCILVFLDESARSWQDSKRFEVYFTPMWINILLSKTYGGWCQKKSKISIWQFAITSSTNQNMGNPQCE